MSGTVPPLVSVPVLGIDHLKPALAGCFCMAPQHDFNARLFSKLAY